MRRLFEAANKNSKYFGWSSRKGYVFFRALNGEPAAQIFLKNSMILATRKILKE